MNLRLLILDYINNNVDNDITTKKIGQLYGLSPTEMYCYLDFLNKQNLIELIKPENINDIPNYRWRKMISPNNTIIQE